MNNPIKIAADVKMAKNRVWEYYTRPEHIVKWNFASEDWHCPMAENNLEVGGEYAFRMEAKNGSFGFTLTATYSQVVDGDSFIYMMADGREVSVSFTEVAGATRVAISFEPESENPRELQQQGWQAILDNFKRYAESENP